jgi:DNA-3-methyladenine glycosylase
MNLLARQPHRVIESAVRGAVGAFGGVAARQPQFQIGFCIHRLYAGQNRPLAPPVRLNTANRHHATASDPLPDLPSSLISINPMAKKRLWAWLDCVLLKCSKAVAAAPQIRVPRGGLLTESLPRIAQRRDKTVPKRLTRSFFNRSVHEVAPDLIGATLFFDGVGGRVVEVEAYHHTDPAAHSFRGPTDRNAVMFGPPGYAYVYRSYGIHWCVNFVCEGAGSASAVLIRAIEPTKGLAAMRRRRGLADERLLCSGPGRLCEALRITDKQNGLPLDRPPFALLARDRAVEVVAGPRIGLTKAVDLPWRYGEKGSRFLSKPFRREA